MTKQITMIELFSGIGAQERALRQLGLPYEITNTCDCDANAVLSYAAMRWDLEKEMETFEFPSQDEMIEELRVKNLGYDFQKGKHTITTRTPITKLKQYYIADKLSKNLGDISKVERLPYVDFWTYSYPCTDLSVAGKGEGMVNKCDKCDHSWPINFEDPKTNNICPNCGNIDIKSTRSGLLGQVQRLLTVSYEEGTLPKYLLLENVKNLVGSKFKPQFDAWVGWLDLIGYNTYYKVLNAKHYGIPQNRERVFAISIRKDVDINGFTFPEQIPLITRLKDMLEKNVDEKYYLPDDRIAKILDSTFMQEKIQKCMPLNYEPEVNQLMNIMPTKTRDNPNQGRVYDVNGIAPTLTKMDGGNREPMVIEPNTCLIQPKDRNYKEKNQPREIHIESKNDGVSHALRTNGETMVVEPFVVASRGRNPENPSDRTVGVPTEQRLEPNFSGCTNTLTSVQKDNYVCEPQVLRAERTEYGKAIRKQYEAGEINEKIGNMREMKPRTDGISNTITTILKDNYVAEPIVCEERKDEGIRLFKDDCVGTLRTIDACGDKRVIEPEINPELIGGIGEKNFGKQYRQGNRVYNSETIAMALNAQPVGNTGGYSYLYAVADKIKWRIRKLTPKCCWRLMNFTDKDVDSASLYVSASALYKQAGNSIVVSCLIALMSSLFVEDGYKAEVWTKYKLHFND